MTFLYQLIDLTHTLDPSIPTWNGECGFSHSICSDYDDFKEDEKFRIMRLQMEAGIGTHMDAPCHAIFGGKDINSFTIDQLCMPCVVIDVSDRSHALYSLSVEDVEIFEARYGIVPQGSCVMVKTGWGQYFNKPDIYRNNHYFPSVSAACADFLLAREVAALGIDTLSPDRPSDGFLVHQIFLGHGKILIENVANLEEMPPAGGHVMICPIKIKDGTEAPIRLVGFVRDCA